MSDFEIIMTVLTVISLLIMMYSAIKKNRPQIEIWTVIFIT